MTALAESFPKEWLQAHPVLPLPSQAAVMAYVTTNRLGELEEKLRNRYELIEREKSDPLAYGYEPETYGEARRILAVRDELLLMGGNREGKSNFAAKYAMETLINKPGSLCAFFHSSEKSSRLQQQPLIFSFLPPVWRAMAQRSKRAAGRGGTYLGYSPGTGFTGDQFILPNQSTGLFFNYKQDVAVMEGYEFDLVWFDELVPLAFLEALTFRLSRLKRLKILTTFTPVQYVSPVVMNYLGGHKIIKTLPAQPLLASDRIHVKDCPPGHMPYVMEGGREGSSLLFFHNGSNPYGAGVDVRKKLKDAPSGVVKMRGFGWPEKQVNGCFSKFSRGAHVVTLEQWERYSKGHGSYYVVTDPGPGGKNWFIKRYFVTPEGWTIVCWEWPDEQRNDVWALPPRDAAEGPGRFCWRQGPAQFIEAGRGIIAYKKLILEAEGWRWDDAVGCWDGTKALRIERRLMDPRMGGSPVPSQDSGTSLIAMMEDEQKDPQGRVVGPSMRWEQAPGSNVGDTVEMIVNAMDFDETQPVNVMNCPKWYVLETCKQSIKSYQEFTNAGGEKDALKDPIDCDRYFVKDDCRYVAPGSMKVRRGGYY